MAESPVTGASGLQHFMQIFFSDMASKATVDVVKGMVTGAGGSAMEPWTKKMSTVFFGPSQEDEQMFNRAVAHAVSSKKISLEDQAKYICAISELFPEMQDVYRTNIIQTWMMQADKKGFESLTPDQVVDHISSVVANHAQLIIGHKEAWKAFVVTQNLNKAVLTKDVDKEIDRVKKDIDELDQTHHQFWKTIHQRAGIGAKIGLAVMVVVAVIGIWIYILSGL